MKSTIVFKTIFIYIIFTIGLSILTEWKKSNMNGLSEFDKYFDKIKEHYKQNYYKEKFIGDLVPEFKVQPKATTAATASTASTASLTEEENILSKVNKRLKEVPTEYWYSGTSDLGFSQANSANQVSNLSTGNDYTFSPVSFNPITRPTTTFNKYSNLLLNDESYRLPK